MFDVVWSGRRHVMMGASQIDMYGNQNFAFVGDWDKPKAQLLGFRGAPGNTIQNTTSYFLPNHSSRVFVPKVDVVTRRRVRPRRRARRRPVAFHELRHVVTNLGVFDFETPDHRMRLRSVHPGVTVDEIVEATGFELVVPDDVPETRAPDRRRARADPRGHRPPRPARPRSPQPVTSRRTPALHTPRVRPLRRRVPDRADRHGLGRRARGSPRRPSAAGGLGILASATMSVARARDRDRRR